MTLAQTHHETNEFSDHDFHAIAEILHKETGIFLGENKKNLVYARLNTLVQQSGFSDFAEYVAHVSARPPNRARQEMISTLTTNVTSFYREPHHFEDLSQRVLPTLLEKARRGERVRLWSAACSSGEEPYTIAFEVLQQAPDAGKFDLKILATDIDPEMVRRAERGVYSDSVTQKTPPHIRKTFLPNNKVAANAKALISFRELNLLDPLPFSGLFDVIFCRNVTIYFDPPTRDKTWQQIVSVLKPSGQLYAGHSERVSGPAAKSLKHNGLTAYKCIK